TLTKALNDEFPDVRRNACKALGRIGEKAARKEVIEALTKIIVDVKGDALENTPFDSIRAFLLAGDDEKSNACITLGRMGEKAATKEVFDALMNAIGVDDNYVRINACEALGLLHYNASVMECLLMSITLDSERSHNCGSAFEWLLVQSSFRKFHERVIRNVTLRLMGVERLSLGMVPVKELSLCIVDQPGNDWSNLVTFICIINCVAVTQNGEGIEFVSEKGHEKVSSADGRLCVKFVKELVDWKKKQGLLQQEDFAGSSVCVLL
ncbi:unnamed protein product, partial [Rotaria socialis]